MFLEVWLSSKILAQPCDRNKISHNGFHQWSSFSQYGWLMSIILALKDTEVEKHHKFKASLDYL